MIDKEPNEKSKERYNNGLEEEEEKDNQEEEEQDEEIDEREQGTFGHSSPPSKLVKNNMTNNTVNKSLI